MKWPQIILVASVGALLFSVPLLGNARQFRVEQVPNNKYECGLCHVDGIGGAYRNDFGHQVEETLTEPGRNGDVQWDKIYEKDADGDGYTNGEELGDPNGDWESGDPDPPGPVSHPAKADKTPTPDRQSRISGCGCNQPSSSPITGFYLAGIIFGLYGIFRYLSQKTI